MHPALPNAFRTFIGSYEGVMPLLNDEQFISRLKANDLRLQRIYPAYEVWPMDGQVALHAIAWQNGNYEFPPLRSALTRTLLPDFTEAAKYTHSPNYSLPLNLGIVQLIKAAADTLRTGKDFYSLHFTPQTIFSFEKSNEVAKTPTPLSVSEFINALSSVFEQIEGVKPDTNQLAMLYGQWSLETNSGKAMFNNAVGNIKITQSQMDSGVKFFSQFTGDPGVVRPDGVIGEGVNHFRAYATLEDGIKSWLQLLKSTRYKAGWDALKNDDAHGFAEGIARGGYVSEPSQNSYIVGIISRNDDFLTHIAPTMHISPPLPSTSTPQQSIPSSSPTVSKAKVALSIGALAAIGTTYLIVHPIAAIHTGLLLRSGYKKTKEFLNPPLALAKKATAK